MNHPSNYILILDSLTDYQDADVIAKVNKIVTTCYGDECECLNVIDVKDIKRNILMDNADMYVFAKCERPSKKFIQVLCNMSEDDYVLEISPALLKHVSLEPITKYVIIVPWEQMSSEFLYDTIKLCKKQVARYIRAGVYVGTDMFKNGDMTPFELAADIVRKLDGTNLVVCCLNGLKEEDSKLYNAVLDVARRKRKVILEL